MLPGCYLHVLCCSKALCDFCELWLTIIIILLTTIPDDFINLLQCLTTFSLIVISVYFGFYKERTIILKTKKKKISVNVLFHLSTLLRCSVVCSIGSCFKSYLLQK